MSAHLYQVGDVVSLNFHSGQSFSKLNPSTGEAQMPHLGAVLQYRIKSGLEDCRRVVAEDQISGLGSQINTAPINLLGSTFIPASASEKEL